MSSLRLYLLMLLPVQSAERPLQTKEVFRQQF